MDGDPDVLNYTGALAIEEGVGFIWAELDTIVISSTCIVTGRSAGFAGCDCG